MFNIAGNNPSGYNLTNSLRFRSSASAYLSRTPASAGNRKTWTWSAWVKKAGMGLEQVLFNCQSGNASVLRSHVVFNTTDTLEFRHTTSGGTTTTQLITTQLFRDPSAWYHIMIVSDTTQATSSDRIKFYINGSQVTAFGTATYPSLNYDGGINQALGHRYASDNNGTTSFDGYTTDMYFIDGQALTPSSFGSTDSATGQWLPKKYTGTYGTNGFYLPFTDNSALTTTTNVGLGKDFSGNGNFFTTNAISITAGTTYDSMKDVPTLTSATVANYAVLNPVATTTAGAVINGNLRTNAADKRWYSSLGMSSGKWYFEYTIVSTNLSVGIGNDLNAQGTNLTGMLTYANSGLKYNGASSSSYGASYTANDVIGVALDMDAGTLVFYKNNVSQGTAFTGLTGTYYASCNTGASGATFVNFGQQPFAYTPPTGYVALNTFNLSTPTILQGNKYMDATLYTGTGATQSITNAGAFRPDLVWIKSRSAATNHNVYDSIRGATIELEVNSTAAESTIAGGLTAFNSNGWTLGNDTGTNTNGATYVGWQWQAGSSTVTNTSGSISAQVRANTTTGFSVVTYTGTGANATVGHGLGVAPAMVIVKRRNSTGNWNVRHVSITAANSLYLNLTNASQSDPTVWNSTVPTSTVFSIGTDTGVNASGGTYVGYCWAEIAGFSKFGSYTGNGSTDGPFIYLGFRPKFVLVKNITTAALDWTIFDSNRDNYNVTNLKIAPNTSSAEVVSTSTSTMIDILSNGFKLRGTGDGGNRSGNTIIYAAFAENPFKNSNAR